MRKHFSLRSWIFRSLTLWIQFIKLNIKLSNWTIIVDTNRWEIKSTRRASRVAISHTTHHSIANVFMLICWNSFLWSKSIQWSVTGNSLNYTFWYLILEKHCGPRCSHAVIRFTINPGITTHFLNHLGQGVLTNWSFFIPSLVIITRSFLFCFKKQHIFLKCVLTEHSYGPGSTFF